MKTISSAHIKLTTGSKQQIITLEEVKKLLKFYQTTASKTGEQLNWNYEDYAFPYKIQEGNDCNHPCLYLSSNVDRYNVIMLEVIQKPNQDCIQTSIQISLTDHSTYGDQTKANEYCKFLAQQLQGELHLFNKRIMHYDLRR